MGEDVRRVGVDVRGVGVEEGRANCGRVPAGTRSARGEDAVGEAGLLVRGHVAGPRTAFPFPTIQEERVVGVEEWRKRGGRQVDQAGQGDRFTSSSSSTCGPSLGSEGRSAGSSESSFGCGGRSIIGCESPEAEPEAEPEAKGQRQSQRLGQGEKKPLLLLCCFRCCAGCSFSLFSCCSLFSRCSC